MSVSVALSLGSIFILVILSAILSGTEAAFLASSRAKLHTLAKEGNKRASIVNLLKEKMEKVISTLLICNNMVNILASSIATGLFISWVGEAGVAYATALMTVIIVIFSEVVPKFYAMRRSESFAMGVAPLLKGLISVFRPITHVFELAARSVLRFMGLKVSAGETLSSTTEELRGIIDLHQGDAETMEERAMLHSILDLGDVSVEDIMVHRQDIKMLNLDDDPIKMITELVESHHTRLPIWQENPDNIIGIIHAKELLKLVQGHTEKAQNITKEDILQCAKKPWFVPETTTLFEQLQAFRKRREHMALVVDEYGALQGIVTLEDIIEEIVGDIDDEHDPNKTEFWKTQNGDVFAIGASTIRDLNRQYDWDLPDEDASTLAGLLMYEARAIPKIGQTFRISGFKMKILRRLRNQITLIKISPLSPSNNENENNADEK